MLTAYKIYVNNSFHEFHLPLCHRVVFWRGFLKFFQIPISGMVELKKLVKNIY